MAYGVNFQVPKRDLGTADLVFDIWNDDEKVGTLKVSNGSVTWFRANTSKGKRFHWKKFAEIVESAEGGVPEMRSSKRGQ